VVQFILLVKNIIQKLEFNMGTMTLKNMKKNYGDVEVLHDISFDIKEGEFIVLIGESGSGKSTLLRMVCGLEDITGGELTLDGVRANDITPQNRNMSMVFQSYALYPHMNVYENISYSLKIKKTSKKEMDKKVQDVVDLLNIGDLLQRLPKELSGGQRQRVAMGRAIIRKPHFFLFDEPLSNLDAKLRVVMRREIRALQKRLKITTIYVTHDQVEAMTMADRIVLLDAGKIKQIGTPKDLYDKPNSIFVASFLGNPNITLINGIVKIVDNVKYICSNDNIHFPIENINSLKENQEIILGIRPMDFYISNKKDGLLVNIDVYEYVGSVYNVFGKIGTNSINIAFSKKDNFDENNNELYINYEFEKAHIFDAKTTEAIRD
jgi:multiple sugar transport system ATP-binding protein